MDFSDQKAIYLQIAAMIYDRILSGEWKPSDRIPSVRELSVMLEVNPNTAMRTYQLLENMNIITLKRGTGFFLTDKAYNNVFSVLKEEYRMEHLPDLFRRISLLKITPQELSKMYQDYLNNNA
jgi:DNA-binding transcriptional regulator YhcF (GntR family)